MANPSLGDVYIDVHANTDPFEPDLERGLKKVSDDAEDELERTGKKFGETIADSMEDELGSHGRDLGRAIERSMDGETIRVRSKIDYYNVRDRRGRFAKIISDEIEEAVSAAGRPGGPIQRLGQAFTDAIGAGFNVPGRSPLIALLIPLVGVIIGLVVAALQAVAALGPVLASLPTILAGIGLQAGVVAIAFNGIGEAATLAFNAKTPEELRKAIEGLTPAAREFVLSLLPVRDLFRDIQRIVQERFFVAFGDSLAKTVAVLAPFLRSGFARLATSMGTLFAALAEFFRSPAFVKFVQQVFPQTAKFLQFFTPALITFLKGIIDLANATMPFLHDLGRLLAGSLAMVGEKFSAIADDPGFNNWLIDMRDTLTSVANLFFTVFEFLAVFLDQLNKAGGKKTIDEITKALEMLIFVLSSPVGQAAMRFLVNFAIFSIQAFTGLVVVVLTLMAVFQSMFDAIGFGVTWLWNNVLKPFFQAIADFFNWLLGETRDFERGTKKSFDSIAGFAKTVSNKIVAAMNVYERLRAAGRNIIRGLIDGITSQLGALWNAMSKAMNVIGAFLPGSPAKQGPLSGRGFAELRGQRMMGDLMAGIKAEMPALRSTSNEVANNIVFGPNSIQMEFHGPVPSQSQARGIGTAVGQSAAGILAARNTRLAVRAL